MGKINFNSKIAKWLNVIFYGYNHEKYWKRREKIVNPKSKTPLLLKYYYFYYIKKIDRKFHCSFGTNIGSGASFQTPPIFVHGIYSVRVGHNVKIGKNCKMAKNISIEHPAEGTTIIGDNVFLGDGCKIKGGVKIGNNVKIGFNTVVVEDIPDNATVVMQKPRVIIKQSERK